MLSLACVFLCSVLCAGVQLSLAVAPIGSVQMTVSD
jgi:hypothetical protein